MKFDRRTPLACISVSTSIWRGLNGPKLLGQQQVQVSPHNGQGRLQFVGGGGQCVPAAATVLFGHKLERLPCRETSWLVASGRPLFRSECARTDSSAPSGKIPDLCSTGILSTKVSLRFSQLPVSSGNRAEALYRGRTDLTANPCIVNAKLMKIRAKWQTSFSFRSLFFAPNGYSSSPQPQEIAFLPLVRAPSHLIVCTTNKGG